MLRAVLRKKDFTAEALEMPKRSGVGLGDLGEFSVSGPPPTVVDGNATDEDDLELATIAADFHGPGRAALAVPGIVACRETDERAARCCADRLIN